MSLLIRTLAVVALAAAGSSAQAADVGVSVQVSQPGVYGRIDIGRFPQPQVVVQQPLIIAAPPPPRAVVVAPPQPVYMWVPPGHQKNWRKHCRHYNACGVPVYFVDDGWYRQNVHARGPAHYAAPDGRRADDDHRGPGRGHGHGRGHGRGRDD